MAQQETKRVKSMATANQGIHRTAKAAGDARRWAED